MGLDFYLEATRRVDVSSHNITHNLARMAAEAGVYTCLWRPDENGFTHAHQIIAPLRAGIAQMEADPERFRALDAPNGWGTYEHFLPWLKEVLEACEENPDAEIRASR